MKLEIVKKLEEDAKSLSPNTSVSLLVSGFIRYLKEPRYQTPLSFKELSDLFQAFYEDLNSTVITTYTQSNGVKKQLISGSQYFKENPKQFDYLLAIANYSSSSIKLVKRSDREALVQLRIFNLYKFLVVWRIIEQAQVQLLQSVSNKDDISLYDKIFGFDERDFVSQKWYDKKVAVLRKLELPFECFIEKDNNQTLIEFINNGDNDLVKTAIEEVLKMKNAVTAHQKLCIIAKFQKDLIAILSEHCDLKAHNINNDILLPVLIYFIVYKLEPLDFCLTFNYIKHFTNFLDPYNVSVLSSTSFYFYNPNETFKSLGKNLLIRKTTLFDCVNLNETNTLDESSDSFFSSDKELIQFINSNYLNNSELQYYLTNFEAVLFFVQNVTLDELTDEPTDDPILLKPLSVFVEKELSSRYEFPPRTTQPEETEGQSRSRSSSLFNTITNRFNEATKSRSRSNSGLLKSRGNSLPSLDIPTETKTSPLASPVAPEELTTYNMMKSIIGRFGSVSVLQFRANGEEEEGLASKHMRSSLIIDKLSPNHSRTRSSSLENASPSRKNTIASKLSSGVTDFMTKLNNPAPNTFNHTANVSQTSLKSLDELDVKRPDLRSRTSSMQIMDKWFNNLSAGLQHTQNGQIPNLQPNGQNGQSAQTTDISSGISMTARLVQGVPKDDAESHESVFSTPSKELARFHNVDFDTLTIQDLRTLKLYYDQLCVELGVNESKLASDLPDQMSSINSI